MWDMAHPVGSVMQVAGGFDPNAVRGEWERVEGAFLLAANSSYAAGSTGGEATHKLTADEMPKWLNVYHAAGIGQGNAQVGSPYIYTNGDYAGLLKLEIGGSHAAHNNMPPYLAVNTWRRVA